MGADDISTKRCNNRLPEIKRDGWTLSLLCDLPCGHEGPCESDADELEIITETVLPDVEQRYYPEIG